MEIGGSNPSHGIWLLKMVEFRFPPILEFSKKGKNSPVCSMNMAKTAIQALAPLILLPA
jgi:hypothetical protein